MSLVHAIRNRVAIGLVGVGLLGTTVAAEEASSPPIQAAAQTPSENAAAAVTLPDQYTLYRREVAQSAHRGARWLLSSQKPDGLFVYGWNPALNRPLPDNNLLRQAGSAAALARAGTVFHDNEITLAARQAILVLLTTYTEPDEKNPEMRRCILAPADNHPVGFNALLLLAISELNDPSDALLEQGDALARYLVSRQKSDGSIDLNCSLADDATTFDDAGIDYYPGEALYALMRSHTRRPAPWKLEAVTKAFAFYRGHWKEKPSMAFVPWQTAAYTEAYLLTQDARFAEFVFEMNDWLATLQYVDPHSADPTWIGGFGSFDQSRPLRTPPGATTGSCAEALVDAYRVAELVKDTRRTHAYRMALDLANQFLMANQYSVTGYPHFEAWFSRKLNGAFYGSVEDGTVRIDFTQHAVCAMTHYLTHVTVATPSDAPAKAN